MKNIIKSLFISLFPVFALIILVKTSVYDSFSLQKIGTIISSFTVVLFFIMLFIRPIARTSKILLPYTISMGIGLLISLFNFDINTVSTNIILFTGWISYLTWYSTFNKRDNTILKVGNKLPQFILENSNGNKIASTSFLKKYSIFIFYRGNWCPLCLAQIKEVVQQYKALEERNINMILVSSQPHKFTENLAKKHQVPFHFLVDVNNTVAKKLGIFHKNGLPTGFQVLGYDSDVILPTVLITDENGKLIFADLTDNYRVRPEPETLIKIIDKYKQK
ncbi:peroxiredoxin family protein [Tenacibaculum maritimum]|uniref:peroxiredoxin family protein n=1 Tax=Tenacibaculum maritimum TaxID=107401 RepID=UPI003877379A